MATPRNIPISEIVSRRHRAQWAEIAQMGIPALRKPPHLGTLGNQRGQLRSETELSGWRRTIPA